MWSGQLFGEMSPPGLELRDLDLSPPSSPRLLVTVVCTYILLSHDSATAIGAATAARLLRCAERGRVVARAAGAGQGAV